MERLNQWILKKRYPMRATWYDITTITRKFTVYSVFTDQSNYRNVGWLVEANGIRLNENNIIRFYYHNQLVRHNNLQRHLYHHYQVQGPRRIMLLLALISFKENSNKAWKCSWNQKEFFFLKRFLFVYPEIHIITVTVFLHQHDNLPFFLSPIRNLDL